MKYTLHLLLVACMMILFSCSDVQFEKPQPVWISSNESSFPQHLRGNYVSDKDTFRISEKRIVDNDKKPDFDLNLSDSVYLKKDSNTYFLNIRNERSKTWTILMATEKKEKLRVYSLSFDDSKILRKLEKLTTLKVTKDSTGKVTNCIINPSEEEFRKIIDQKLFKLTLTLKKIN